jgi:hypothetical protein
MKVQVFFSLINGPFWASMLGFISGQADSIPDADAILQLHLPTDMHIHQSTKLVFLVFARGLWVVHRTYIHRIYTGVSPSVHFLTAE